MLRKSVIMFIWNQIHESINQLVIPKLRGGYYKWLLEIFLRFDQLFYAIDHICSITVVN